MYSSPPFPLCLRTTYVQLPSSFFSSLSTRGCTLLLPFFAFLCDLFCGGFVFFGLLLSTLDDSRRERERERERERQIRGVRKATMNEKAFVTKDLHDKHTKILEGLLKLPENRHCADCQSNGPRWASVNLGVFICLQCSGIHRSLGVHISKVRSTTLDTWLPEQVAFMQCMGNKRSNMHWEAELPPDYDRSGTEKFIHAKYEEKRWVAKDAAQPSPECIDMCRLSNEHVEGGSKNQIPKKLRNFSLEEEILSTHTVQVGPPPPVKQRGCSLDMNDITLSSAEPTESLPTSELDTSAKKDLFSLLYSRPPQQHRPSRHPTNWATFD